jgi:type IV secretion system protein VirD4
VVSDYEDDEADIKRRFELDQRANRWQRELDEAAQDHKLEYERQQEDVRRGLDRERDASRRAIERQSQDVKRSIEWTARHRGGGGGGPSSSPAGQYQSMDDLALRIAVYVAAVLAVVAAFVLVTGHIAALAYDGSFPRYETGDIPGILTRFAGHPGDPSAAWDPVNHGGEVPGPLGWWAIFVVLVLLVGALSFLVYAVRSTHPAAQLERPRADWTKPSAVPELRPAGGTDTDARLVVGTSGRSKLALGPLHSLLVVGPAHAGKTSGLAIPALLEWPGPAVVASTRSHLMDETIGWRSHRGDVHVFDPAAITRYHRSGWSLLSDCGTWQGAIRVAQHLTAAAQALPDARILVEGNGAAGAGGLAGAGAAAVIEPGRSQLWTSAMAMALAPFLYAAAAGGKSVMDAARWIEREERDEVLAVLRRFDQAATNAHETTFFRDDPSRSRFFHLMFQVLSVYADPTVDATAAKHEIVPAELLDGGHHTLYLTAPEHDQVRFQPLFATIVRQMLTAINDRFAAEGTPLDPPILFLLDEAFGVTSVEDLAAIAATGASKGVQVVSIFQDMGRLEGLLPNAASLLAKNHRAMLVVGRDHDLAGAAGAAPSDERRFWADLGALLGDGEAALLYGTPRPVRLRLRRWFKDGELSRRVATAQDAVAPSEKRLPSVYRSPLDTSPAFSMARQTSAWLRGRRTGPEGDETLPARRGEAQFDDVVDLPEDDPPPDNVTQLPGLGDRPPRRHT